MPEYEYRTSFVLDLACQLITSVSISPDRSLLATADGTPAVRIWALSRGAEMGKPRFPKLAIPCDFCDWVKFFGDSSHLLARGFDGSLWLCDVHASEYRQLAVSSGGIVNAAVGHNGRVMALGTVHGSVLLWDPNEDRLLSVIERDDAIHTVTCVAVSSSDDVIVWSKSGDNDVVVHEIRDPPRRRNFVGHSGTVLSVDCAANGRYLASAGSDNTVRLWNIADGKQLATLYGEGNIIRDAVFSPNGSFLAVANAYRSFSVEDLKSPVSLFRTSDASKVADLVGHLEGVTCLSFSNDGRMLASGGDDGRVIVWDTRFCGEKEAESRATPNIVAAPEPRSAVEDGSADPAAASGAHQEESGTPRPRSIAGDSPLARP
jgi:WD40 repeat protein